MRLAALAVTTWLLAASALVFAEPPGRQTSIVGTLLDDAVAYYRVEGAEPALPRFKRLVEMTASDPRGKNHAMALHYVGECHWRLGNYHDAARFLNRALAIERASGDLASEGKTVNVLGLLAWDEGEYQRAQDSFTLVAARGRAVGDPKMEGSALNNLGLVLDELGDYDASLAHYRKALQLYEGADFPRGEGDSLGNIGGVYLLLGRYREARSYYEQSLRISERLQSKASLSQDHGNIGLCLLGLGEVQAARERFERAASLAKQAGMRSDEAYWLREQGNALIQQGRYDLALSSQRTALAIYEDADAKAERVETLSDLGRLYLLLGDLSSAETSFEEAHATSVAMRFDRGITFGLIALGDVAARKSEFSAAERRYSEALARATDAGQPHLVSLSLLRLAAVDLQQGKAQTAAAHATRALDIARREGYRDRQAEAGWLRGEAARRQGRLPDAMAAFDESQRANASIGDPEILWRVDLGRAKAFESMGKFDEAIRALERAAEVIESVRGRLQQPRFRAGYLEDKYEVYRELMRLQLERGQVDRAFGTAERLRARAYVDQLDGRHVGTMSPAARARETELRERIRHLRRVGSDRDDGADGTTYSQRARDRFSAELLQAERDYQAFLDDMVRPSSVIAPAAAQEPAALARSRLGANDALVEFLVGPSATTAFVVRREDIQAHVLPVRQEDLQGQVDLLRHLVESRAEDARWRKPASRLYRGLMAPLHAAGTLREARHLYIVAHGPLSDLSFAMLPTGESPTSPLLIDRYSLTYLPAAAALAHPASTSVRGHLLALAPARSRLPHAAEESRVVNAMYAPNATLLVGSAATESRFKRESGSYRIVHVASHGFFDRANPLFSGVELEADESEDGLLQVHEVLGLKLNARLVTLSACETGLASGYFSDQPAGDAFIGMSRAFLTAGSDAVMATLWRVEDKASLRLVREFYGAMLPNDERSSLALAQAQRRMRRTKDLAHPYYWAGYVVVGDSASARRTLATAGR